MTTSFTRPISWDIYQEHLDEAAWLWGEWEASLDSSVYAIADVAIGPEERLLAHLDGLVLGEAPVAEKLLIPALGSDDVGLVAAAAWVLIQAEDADHQDKVIEALAAAEPATRAALGRALLRSPRADISRLIPLWDTATPALRALIIDAIAPREPDWARQRISPIMRSGNLAQVAAALRAIRILRDEAFKEPVQLAMQIEEPRVLREALAAGLTLGIKITWDVCRVLAEAKDETCRFPLGLLASSADPSDRALVRAKAADPEVAVHALWALGFAGDVESADVLVEALERAGQVAGEALSAITGVVIEGALRKQNESHGPDVEEVGLDDPPPEVWPEDALAEPAVENLRKWWGKERARFKHGLRYLYGHPRGPETLRAALVSAPTWRREVFSLELASTEAGVPRVDLQGWAKEQLVRLRQT